MRRPGFTLVEVLVVVGLFVFILGVILASVVMGQRSMAISQAQISAIGDARRGLEAMAREIVQAPLAEISDETGGSPWPPAGAWSGIRFRYPESVDTNGAVNSWSPTITYALQEDQLVRTDSDGGSRVLANGVTVLSFEEGAAPEEVVISLTTQRTATSGHVVAQPLGMRVRLRNA